MKTPEVWGISRYEAGQQSRDAEVKALVKAVDYFSATCDIPDREDSPRAFAVYAKHAATLAAYDCLKKETTMDYREREWIESQLGMLRDEIRSEIRLGVRAVVLAILYHSDDEHDVGDILDDLYPEDPPEEKASDS